MSNSEKTRTQLVDEVARLERAFQALLAVCDRASWTVGEDFFHTLVRRLTASLDVRFALVTEFGTTPQHLRVVALCEGEHPRDSFEFEIKGTPCEHVFEKRTVFFPAEVQEIFPDDRWLKENGIESYLAIALQDPDGEPIGHLGVMHDKRLPEDVPKESILRILASHAGAELGRRHAERALRESEQRLRGIFTERKRSEDQIRQLQAELAHAGRVSTAGQMATGLAHELSQPLAAIVAYADGCIQRMKSGGWQEEALLRTLGEIKSEAEQAGRVIRRLRNFVRKREPRRSTIRINKLVEQTVALLEAVHTGQCQMSLHLAAGLPDVEADSVQIQQVLLNLLRNALESMDEIPAGERELSIRTKIAAGNGVEIAVEDRGRGLLGEHLDSMFEPFFTTRSEGLGLGLSISKAILEAHGGRLWATRNRERGATFHFSLPRRATLLNR